MRAYSEETVYVGAEVPTSTWKRAKAELDHGEWAEIVRDTVEEIANEHDG